MSSPKVITAQKAPHRIALAANRSATARYLALALELYNQIQQLQSATAGKGGVASELLVPTYQEAHTKAWAIYDKGDDAGYPAVLFAHAYWQSLKHPWHDQALKSYSEATAEETKQLEMQQQRLEELTSAIASDFKTHHQYSIQRIESNAVASTHPWDQRISDAIDGIARAARPDEIDGIRQSLLGIAEKNPQEMYVALKTLRLSVEHAQKLRMQAEALRTYKDKQHELTRERVNQQLEQCERRLETLESEEVLSLADDLGVVRDAAKKGDFSEELEDRVHALDESIRSASERQSLLEATVAALRRMGYETVEVMSMLGPPEIASVYLQDPGDAERVALVQIAEEHSMMSSEIVRLVASDTSKTQRMLDTEAQKRLCKAMATVEEELSQFWTVDHISQTAPGAPPQVKSDLRRPTGSRVQVGSQLRSKK